MCDYSLAGVPNRLAVEGEQLVVHRFSTGSVGLASPCSSLSSKETAVCIPPGARLRLRDIHCLYSSVLTQPKKSPLCS